MSRNTSARGKAPSAYHHGDLRAALIALALWEIEKQGPEAISLSALARALGVTQPAPYRHFADREALLAAVAAEGFRIFGDLLSASVVDAPLPRRLKRICAAYVEFGRSRSGLYRLMFGSRIVANASAESHLLQVAEASFQQLIDELSKAGSSGGDKSNRRRALGVWAALHGIVTLEHQGFLHKQGIHATPVDTLIADIAERVFA